MSPSTILRGLNASSNPVNTLGTNNGAKRPRAMSDDELALSCTPKRSATSRLMQSRINAGVKLGKRTESIEDDSSPINSGLKQYRNQERMRRIPYPRNRIRPRKDGRQPTASTTDSRQCQDTPLDQLSQNESSADELGHDDGTGLTESRFFQPAKSPPPTNHKRSNNALPTLAPGHHQAPIPVHDDDADSVSRRKKAEMATSLPRRSPEPRRIYVKKAFSGKDSFIPEEGTDCFYTLKPKAIELSGSALSPAWLGLDVGTINHVFYSKGDCPHVMIKRSKRPDQPQQLDLKLQDYQQARSLATWLIRSSNRMNIGEQKESYWMRDSYKKSQANVKYTVTQDDVTTVVNSGRKLADTAPILPWQPKHSKQLQSPDKLLSEGLITLPGKRKRSHAELQGRSQRSSNRAASLSPKPQFIRFSPPPLPPSSPLRAASPPRWTISNPDWDHSWGPRSLVYPATGRIRETVAKDDISKLDDGTFLNDNIINFYLRYMITSSGPEVTKRVHVMNSFWYDTLSSARRRGINYDGVKNWTAKMDIFQYDYIVVPVNQALHWYLAIICNPGSLLSRTTEETIDEPSPKRQLGTGQPENDTAVIDVDQDAVVDPMEPVDVPMNELNIADDVQDSAAGGNEKVTLIPSHHSSPEEPKGESQNPADSRDHCADITRVLTLDSLDSSHSPTCAHLRDFLFMEAKSRHGIDLDKPRSLGLTAKNIPMQDNFSDCGVFLLAYVARFLQDPDGFIRTIVNKEPCTWDIDASGLRNEIREIILSLKKSQNERDAAEDRAKAARKKLKAEKLKATKPKSISQIPKQHPPQPAKIGAEIPKNTMNDGTVKQPIEGDTSKTEETWKNTARDLPESECLKMPSESSLDEERSSITGDVPTRQLPQQSVSNDNDVKVVGRDLETTIQKPNNEDRAIETTEECTPREGDQPKVSRPWIQIQDESCRFNGWSSEPGTTTNPGSPQSRKRSSEPSESPSAKKVKREPPTTVDLTDDADTKQTTAQATEHKFVSPLSSESPESPQAASKADICKELVASEEHGKGDGQEQKPSVSATICSLFRWG